MIHFWPQRWWLRLALVTLAALVLPYVFSRLASPQRCVTVFSSVERESQSAAPAQLRVVSYNIAHGRGLASSNWDGGDRANRSDRLADIANLLRELDADVVVLNEVDFDASWSGHINQAERLAELAGYPYRVEQRNLDFRVLGWTWRFGNAVLSKQPIVGAEVIDLPELAIWEAVLVGKKRAMACDLQVGEQTVRVVAAHLSHRSEALRVQSAQMLVELAREGELPTIVAGDLNSTPAGFPNSKVDADGMNAIGVFDESELLRRSPADVPRGSEAFTFPANAPSQVIDWVLIPSAWRFVEYRVVPTTLSDHLPVVAVATWHNQAIDEP